MIQYTSLAAGLIMGAIGLKLLMTKRIKPAFYIYFDEGTTKFIGTFLITLSAVTFLFAVFLFAIF